MRGIIYSLGCVFLAFTRLESQYFFGSPILICKLSITVVQYELLFTPDSHWSSLPYHHPRITLDLVKDIEKYCSES